MRLDSAEKARLLKLARATLNAFDSDAIARVLLDFEANPENLSAALKEERSCFVTLLTKSDRLRGCIGTLKTSNSLYRNVVIFTQHAAFEDPRFEPVEKSEVPGIKIHVAVLGETTPVSGELDFQIGTHGLCVSSPQKRRRGVLLASVAVDYGWGKEEFIRQTCEKAGLSPADWRNYTLEKFEEVSFGE